MNLNFNIESFIGNKITGRTQSLFALDIKNNTENLLREIKGQRVLVIGAAGTIGSSYTQRLLAYEPAKLVIVDTNENGLTEFVRDCRSRIDISLPTDFKSYPINFGSDVFYKMIDNEGPFDIVANFAAHKHVRSEKDEYSIEAMIENNVLKAHTFMEYLKKNKPKHFFCVSTDKAANPVNIMGASKKLMEDLVLAYSKEFKITTARFANVAFSNGSLLEGFINRLFKKQPLSCPSDVTRFFVSPIEAGEICLMACILGKNGDIYFPKLNPEKDLINFKDIALNFLTELGYEADVCSSEEEAKSKAAALTKESKQYPICIFDSDTSGEKLYEEFFTDTEEVNLTDFESLGYIPTQGVKSIDQVSEIVDSIKTLFSRHSNKAEVVRLLKEILPGFEHIETGKNLDQKM